MNPDIQARVDRWLANPIDNKTKSEIRKMLQKSPSELADAFYRDLSFGTGGMRGIMGVGTNRMNIYTVRSATQGLANYILKNAANKSVFIGYDVRNDSRLFAEETAKVLAGNKIKVFITETICPTPLASFGCRHYHCTAAVMITASHNPPQYNGYKVFWSDGAQVVHPQDDGITREVRSIQNFDQIKFAELSSSLIHWVRDEIDDAYFKELDQIPLFANKNSSSLKIIYSNLHGTGLRLVEPALKRQGFSHIQLVKEQATLDGHFPFAPSPNPEEEQAMALGTQQLVNEQADLFLATDPDADRLGAVVRNQDRFLRLNGNQIACLCLFYIASELKAKKELPPQAAFIKTIVTSEMARKIADSFHIACFDVLTGFKYIAELIREWEHPPHAEQFIFGAEESHGFLIETFVRDKDAISAACLLCKAADQLKQQNRTLIDLLYDLYRVYGVYRQSLTTLAFEDSEDGMNKMKTLMQNLRKTPPASIQGHAIKRIDDYMLRKSINLQTKEQKPLTLPSSDVLSFWLSDQSKLVIRPSGTEPKIKIYAEVCNSPSHLVDESIKECDHKLSEIISSFKKLIKVA